MSTRAFIFNNGQAGQSSISLAPIKHPNTGGTTNRPMLEKFNFMRRFTSRYPIFDATITHCVAVKNRQKKAMFCTFRPQRNEYHLYRKSENRTRFYA